MNELAIVNAPAIPAIKFSPDTMKVDKLKADYPIENIPEDLSIEENYTIVCDGCKAHQKGRTDIEKTHKQLKKPYWDTGKQLDGAKNEMLNDLEPIESAWRKAKKDHDDIETKRLEAIETAKQEAIDKITNKIAWINGYSARLIGKTSTEIKEAIEQLKVDDIGWAGDMVESAKNIKDVTLVKLDTLHNMAVSSEKTALVEAENERLEQVDQKTPEPVQPSNESQCHVEKTSGPQEKTRHAETIEALTEILRSDKPAVVLAGEIVGKVELGEIPNLFFK